MTTFNLFEDRGADRLFPLAVNVPLADLGDGAEDIAETVRRDGFARVGGGAAPAFHVEMCTDAGATLDTVRPLVQADESALRSAMARAETGEAHAYLCLLAGRLESVL